MKTLKTIFDGVNVVQVAGLGVLTLLPLVTYALMGFACGKSHRWDFVGGLFKATAALTFTFNVCVAAWYMLKFYHGLTAPTIVVSALGVAWYFALCTMTINLSPAGRLFLIKLAKNEGRPS